jgi:clan AA aspartic protease (TIGR02281 family)
MMNVRIILLILFFLVGFIPESAADTVYLKNGRSIEGLIAKETEEKVELDVGFGTVTFRMGEIEKIDRSDSSEAKKLLKKWDRERKIEKVRQKKVKEEKAAAREKKRLLPKKVPFTQEGDSIMVEALLNKKLKVNLVLDTGASTVLLSNKITKKLRIKSNQGSSVQVQMADGRKVDAKYIVLDSVSVKGVEAEDVGAVVFSDDVKMESYDGLLGMSFLNKFNFQIDTENNKLILERRK